MKTLTAIPIAELIKKAGSKRRVAQIAGIQNLGSLSHESVVMADFPDGYLLMEIAPGCDEAGTDVYLQVA